MIAPNPLLIINETTVGKGIFAAVDIIANTDLCKINGEILPFSETLRSKKESYFLQVSLNSYIKPDFPFYLFNHSCNPNCGINEQLNLITIAEVKKGEELRWDYSTSMLERSWNMECVCNDPVCRKVIKDFDTLPLEIQKRYLDLNIVLPYIKKYLSNRIL